MAMWMKNFKVNTEALIYITIGAASYFSCRTLLLYGFNIKYFKGKGILILMDINMDINMEYNIFIDRKYTGCLDHVCGWQSIIIS
jgi:hypothetical protein